MRAAILLEMMEVLYADRFRVKHPGNSVRFIP